MLILILILYIFIFQGKDKLKYMLIYGKEPSADPSTIRNIAWTFPMRLVGTYGKIPAFFFILGIITYFLKFKEWQFLQHIPIVWIIVLSIVYHLWWAGLHFFLALFTRIGYFTFLIGTCFCGMGMYKLLTIKQFRRQIKLGITVLLFGCVIMAILNITHTNVKYTPQFWCIRHRCVIRAILNITYTEANISKDIIYINLKIKELTLENDTIIIPWSWKKPKSTHPFIPWISERPYLLYSHAWLNLRSVYLFLDNSTLNIRPKNSTVIFLGKGYYLVELNNK
jgi:hypothetical protein